MEGGGTQESVRCLSEEEGRGGKGDVLVCLTRLHAKQKEVTSKSVLKQHIRLG